jgi:DNA-binding NarL/FixJ family response regulator
MEHKKTVQIIDRHPVFRAGLKGIIESESDYKIVGESATARQGLDMADRLRPHVIILDLMLPDMDGIRLTRELSGVSEHSRIMIVSIRSEINYVVRSIQAGASGYILKESGTECLTDCLRRITTGKQFIDPSLSESLCELFMFINSPLTDNNQTQLTAREQEIMQMVAENLSSKDIAEKLCISPKTVETHRYNMMKKLGLKNKVALIQYAVNIGIVDPDIWKQGCGSG